MDETMRQAIVAEILAATRVEAKTPWQFDVLDYMAQSPGIKRSRAFQILLEMVRAGELRTGLARHNGKQVRVFWRERDVPG